MAEGGVGLSELLTKEDFLFHYENLLLAKGRRKTYLCYEPEGKKPVVLRNEPKSCDKPEGTHAEILFVEDLKALDPKFNDQVTCYLSWSPCAECSKTLVQFVKQNTEVKLRILASRLYFFEEEDNREGLRLLHAAGVSIDIMAKKDFEDCWDLFVDSNEPFPPWEELKENSDYFIGELQDILQEVILIYAYESASEIVSYLRGTLQLPVGLGLEVVQFLLGLVFLELGTAELTPELGAHLEADANDNSNFLEDRFHL